MKDAGLRPCIFIFLLAFVRNTVYDKLKAEEASVFAEKGIKERQHLGNTVAWQIWKTGICINQTFKYSKPGAQYKA